MEAGSEVNNSQFDGFKKPKRQMKTPYQLEMLEKTYLAGMHTSEATRAKLSVEIGLTDRQMQMWFCHRRLKDKKEVTVKKPEGGHIALMRPSKEERMVAERGGGSDHGSRHESWSRSRSRSGSGFGAGSSEDNEPLVHSREHKLNQQKMMRRKIIDWVMMQLGESFRDDGPVLGTEFDEVPPGAFAMHIGEHMNLMRSSKQELRVKRGGVSHHGSQSRSGSGSASDSREDREPLVHSREYELTQQNMMRKRILDCVEMQLGESFRKDGPVIGTEFDEVPPGAFGMPIAVAKKHHSQNHEGNLYEQPPIKVEGASLHDDAVPNIKREPHGAVSRSYDSQGGYQRDIRLAPQKGLPLPYLIPEQLKGVGLSSPVKDNDFNLPNEEFMQMWRKRKSEEGIPGRNGHPERRMKKELEKKDFFSEKNEEQIIKETERQDPERRKEEERMMREKQRQEERFQREENREIERREKFLQKESLMAERRRQKEAIKQKAAIEMAAAKKIANKSMELIEEERLLELASSSKGLTSIASLDFKTLQNLDSLKGFKIIGRGSHCSVKTDHKRY